MQLFALTQTFQFIPNGQQTGTQTILHGHAQCPVGKETVEYTASGQLSDFPLLLCNKITHSSGLLLKCQVRLIIQGLPQMLLPHIYQPDQQHNIAPQQYAGEQDGSAAVQLIHD
ncbi:hypothetical protein [Thiolapillus sp.]|uniref:hypothetical protein n=1 Tax=Thiolapillus sp. TaxID=2017437 RepID=UPI003AF59C3F